MSAPETPVETEAVQLLRMQQETNARLDALTDAINGLGQNVQWIIDNVQGIFQMFQNPAVMGQIAGMMGGMGNGGQADGPSGE
jgi:hypothetical protein